MPVIDTGRVPAGGVVALADQLDLIRHSGDTVVALDAGDMFTGPLASTTAEGAPVVVAYAILGVDAAAIGNHDFDFGPVGYDKVLAKEGVGDEAGADGPRGVLMQRMAEAPFPFLSANIRKKGGAAVAWPKLAASTTVVRGGYRVGVVGYSTRDTPGTTLLPNVADLEFATDAAKHVGEAIRALRASGASPVVLIAHASLEGELPTSLEDKAQHKGEMDSLIQALGADTPDLIVGGHRHAWALGRVRGVPFVTSDQHGVGLARARYCVEGADKTPHLQGIERRTALATTPPLTELGRKVALAMAPWEERVRATAEAKVAHLPAECAPRGLNGTGMDDQIARAGRLHITEAATPPMGSPVVGLINVGAVRAPLAAGDVRGGDIFTTFPFENTVAACGTTKAGLRRAIENMLKKDATRERFPLGISGATVHVQRAKDNALTLGKIEVEGLDIDAPDSAPVWLSVTDFMLYGGDGLLEGVDCKPRVASQLRLRDVWRDLLAKEGRCDGDAKSVLVDK
jgi:5'-nucleotidase